MKIGYDAKRIFHNFRGLGNYSRTLFEGLNKFYPDNSYYLYTPPFKDKRSLEWIKKYPHAFLKTPTSTFAKTFSSAWRSLFMSDILAKDDLDVYHGLSHELPRNISKLKCKKIVTIHDLIFLRYPELFPWIDRVVYLKKFKHSCENADIIFAICQQTKNDIIEMLHIPEQKIEVVYQSCHYYFYNKLEPQINENVLNKYNVKKPFFLSVGAIEPRKNTIEIVNAFYQIQNDVVEDLVIIGKGKSYQDKLEARIQELKLNTRVKILSTVEFKELASFYQEATCFIYPSLFEGFGLPVVESFFSETPVILSHGSSFPEAAGEAGYFINPHKPEEIAEGMLKFSTDKNFAIEKIRLGRKHVEKFHWRNTSENVMSQYKKIL